MSAASTQILDAVAAALAAAYPTAPVETRRGTPHGAVYKPGDDLPRLYVRILDGEDAEEVGWWDDGAGGYRAVLVKYPLVVTYAASVEPNEAGDDGTTRDVREGVRKLLHRPNACGLAFVNDVFVKGNRVWQEADKAPTVNLSELTFTVEAREAAES